MTAESDNAKQSGDQPESDAFAANASGDVPPVLNTGGAGGGDREPTDAEIDALEAQFRPKKQRWHLFVLMGVVVLIGLAGGGVLIVKTVSKVKARRAVATTRIASSSVAIASPTVDAYGDRLPGQSAPGISTQSNNTNGLISVEADEHGSLPGVRMIPSQAIGGAQNANSLELSVPTIQTSGDQSALYGASSSSSTGGGSSDSGDDYGDSYGDNVAGGSGSNTAVSVAGQPVIIPQAKGAKPEVYFAEITPLALVDQANGGAGYGAARVQQTSRERAQQLPPPGAVLGGNASSSGQEPFAPSDTMVKCELAFAVDSIGRQAPIIGMTTQDLVYDGHLIVPKNTEVVGSVGSSYYETATTGRILSTGSWRLIMPAQPGQQMGRELVVHAQILSRRELVVSPSGRVRQWDPNEDGKPGLFGAAITTTDKTQVRKALLDLLKGVITRVGEAQKDQATMSAATGGIVTGDAQTMRNIGVDSTVGALSGLLDARVNAVTDEINRSGTYVSVGSGAKFYLLIEDPILPDSALIGRAVLGESPGDGGTATRANAQSNLRQP